jgi:hypothetical protein
MIYYYGVTEDRGVLTRVVGHECLRLVLLLLGVKDDGPPVEPDLLGVDDVSEEVEGILAPGVAGAPPEDAGKVVAGAEGHNGARRRGALAVLADVVQALEYPADGAVPSANQDLVVLYVPEHVEPGRKGRGEADLIYSAVVISAWLNSKVVV